MTDTAMLPESWRGVLGEELQKPYFKELTEFVEEERAKGPVYPPREEVFAALDATPYDQVKVLVLGQDPYHGEGQGHGLCFSVRPGCEDAALAAEHLQGDAGGAGPPGPGQRLSDAVGRAGRAAAQRGADGPRRRGQLAQGQGLGEVHRRGDPRRGRPARPGGLRAVGQLRAEEAPADRRGAARRGEGRAPLAAVREEVLRLPPVHPDQRGGRRAGPRRRSTGASPTWADRRRARAPAGARASARPVRTPVAAPERRLSAAAASVGGRRHGHGASAGGGASEERGGAEDA